MIQEKRLGFYRPLLLMPTSFLLLQCAQSILQVYNLGYSLPIGEGQKRGGRLLALCTKRTRDTHTYIMQRGCSGILGQRLTINGISIRSTVC